ncbi:MAG: nitrophenyl compound nitroreductase subunit ArsF family protein [Acidobacteriota bacterium]
MPAPVRKAVATYFHGNVRCVTCRKIEAYAQEAVQDAFEQQLAAGTVEFRVVNVEEDANRHFIQDYQLVSKTLVVTEEVDGAVARWAKLDDVWTLVSDRTAFFRYVQGGVRNYVAAQ